jgi:UDP-N-acetylmuramoylalanine--D-glutamate ligase
MNQFKNKKILIMGLGLNPKGSGITAAKFFVSSGAKVTVTDLKTKKELAPSLKLLKNFSIKYVLGRHDKEDFKNADLIIKNPGVRQTSKYLKIAKRNGVPIETDVGIFLENSPARIIGVTGTRGKSTTAALIGKMLKTKYGSVFVGGNIQFSPLNFLNQISKNSKVILELSSWMLEDTMRKIHPRIAVLTNIMPDHLNTYKNFDDYVEAKALIFKNQTKNDFAILNHDDLNVRKLTRNIKAKKIWFSKKNIVVLKKIIPLKEIALPGEHNISNILAAVAVAKFEGVSNRIIQNVLKIFKGLPNRLEFVRKAKGLKFYNDTTSTMPEATIAALKTLGHDKNIILIAGGADKKLDYKKLGREIKKYCKAVVLFEGNASGKILKTIKHNKKITINGGIKTMKDAVRNVVKLAEKNDIILLSPGAASFGLFQNEFDRGEQFVKIVKKL